MYQSTTHLASIVTPRGRHVYCNNVSTVCRPLNAISLTSLSLSLLASSHPCSFERFLHRRPIRIVDSSSRTITNHENTHVGISKNRIRIDELFDSRAKLTRKSSRINTCSATFNLSPRWWGNVYVDGVAGSTRQSLEWCTRVGLSFIIRHEYLAPIPLTRYPNREVSCRCKHRLAYVARHYMLVTTPCTPSCKSMQAWRKKKPRRTRHEVVKKRNRIFSLYVYFISCVA